VEPDERMKLVSESCWRKLVSKFPLIGPEIMFVCEKEPVAQKNMPDLEPITIKLEQFEMAPSQLVPINLTTGSQMIYGMSAKTDRKILVSKN